MLQGFEGGGHSHPTHYPIASHSPPMDFLYCWDSSDQKQKNYIKKVDKVDSG